MRKPQTDSWDAERVRRGEDKKIEGGTNPTTLGIPKDE